MRRNGLILDAVALTALCACQAESPEAAENAVEEIEKSGQSVTIVLPAAEAASEADQPSKAGQPSNAAHHSQFTSIDPGKCRLLEQNLEEGGWWRRLCAGHAGYKLELSESDLRQDIVVIPPGARRSELGLSDIVANGAFNSLGKTAEWRGSDPAAPSTLIVRLNVASDPEAKRPDISRLVVVRLKPPACIVAVVPPGAGQNEAARSIADGNLPACLRR